MLDPATTSGLALLNAEVTRQGTMIGYSNVFGWMTLAIVLLAPLILVMRPAAPVRQNLEPHAE